jgi:hypothetical protein
MAGFAFRFARPAATPHGDAGGFQIAADRLTPDAGRFLDARERPAQSPQRQDLMLCVVVQDVAHPGEGLHVQRLRQRLGRRQLICRF